MNQKTYTVYIITNKNHTTLYTGVTNDATAPKSAPHSPASYKATKLVYMEHCRKA